MRWLVFIWAAFVVGSIVAFSPQAGGQQPQPNELSAEEILDRMASTYAQCKTYRDTGLVKTIFFQANGDRTVTSVKSFHTAFLRPDRFLLEYSEKRADGETSRYIIWRQGDEVRTWWDRRPQVERPASLGAALSVAMGPSSGTARRIAALLMPREARGPGRVDILQPKRREDGKVGDVECYRIEGQPRIPELTSKTKGLDPESLKAGQEALRQTLKSKGVSEEVIEKSLAALKDVEQREQTVVRGPVTLWIDKQTFLLRRLDESSTFPNFRTEQTTTYEPVLDAEILPDELEFNAPRA